MIGTGPASSPPLSRRGLLQGAGAGALAATFGAQAQEARPRRGGILRIAAADQSSTDTFDPVLARSGSDYLRAKAAFNALTWVNSRAEAVPDLAESFESDPQAMRWVFRLRKGVRFHDGSPVRTADVVYSIMRHKTGPSLGSAIVANVASVAADGPDSVVFTLTSPDVSFPLAMSELHMSIVKEGTTEFSRPIGTGPFRIETFQPGVRTIGTRNPEYWVPDRPYVDGFELIPLSDMQSRVNALLAGDVHLAVNLRGVGIDQVRQSTAAKLLTTPTAGFASVHMRVDMKPSDNLDLRLALAHLMDRRRFVEVVLRGQAVLGNDVPILSTSPLYNTDLPQRALDPDRAKFHLGRAGIGSAPVEVYVTDAANGGIDIGQLLQREAARAGLNLSLKRVPADGYWVNVSGMHPFTNNQVTPRPSDDMNIALFWKSNGAFNKCRFTAPGFDALADEARATHDQGKRRELYFRMQKLIHDTTPQVIPAMQSYVDGISNRVMGIEPVPVGYLGGFNGIQNAWLGA
ncbi:ABC transporter substrate-binding protein [Belnapia sp. T6]|uniref:ABC transporter substrate-binding protein n=1 Tax=Belnapia mucosa TaxID=2804532 RepID=A0ABS1UZ89_9PROT|nr:ABC transporter substrate-binding protein [Belnapia mucosa]MBL6454617.1 ABC transporter substrate-binding protein [Belnapia mucosa]